MSNSFILLTALNSSKELLSTTQLSEIIANQSKGKIVKASGALKDSLEIHKQTIERNRRKKNNNNSSEN